MNTGIISSRYADALLKYVKETGEGTAVFRQAGILYEALQASGKFARLLESQTLFSSDEKMALVRRVFGEEKMCLTMEKFLRLVLMHGRVEYLRYMLYDFRERWYDANGIRHARLVVSAPSPELEERLKRISREITGKDLEVKTEVDPSLIGGFVFEVDDKRVDASVSRQLSELKRRFEEKNNRF